jgi:ABC-type polysaccharide/polyol phosphate export permease
MIGESVSEIFRSRALLWNLVRRDLVVRYKRSILGIFWTMLHPVINTLVYALIFSAVFRFQIRDYGVYFL